MDETIDLFNRRLLIVSGKGGVGKSTVSAALAVMAARQGKRVLLVELAGQCAMCVLLGGASASYELVNRGENLSSLSVTPEASMEEYLVRELHSKMLFQLIFKNHYVGPFIAAVPGLEDLMSIGKVMDLERTVDKRGRPAWDLIVLDAPSTGQGLNLLRVPRAMMDMARVGPFYKNTKLIQDLITDPSKTALNLVTLPEEMPVNETIEMYRQMHHELGIPLGYLIVNNLREMPLTQGERAILPELVAAGPAVSSPWPKQVGSILRTAAELERRARLERAHVNRLREAVPLPVLELPALFRRNLSRPDVEHLAGILSRGLHTTSLREVA